MANVDHAGYKKIQCWIPETMWDKIESLGYPNQTSAVTEAFDLLLTKSQNIPDSSHEIPILRAKIEFLQMVLDERERVIEEKDRRITDLNRFSYTLENREFKLIESQGERTEKPTEEIKPNVHEHVTKPASSAGEALATPHKEKELIKKTCKNCGVEFGTANPKKETCSSKCRSAYSRKRNN